MAAAAAGHCVSVDERHGQAENIHKAQGITQEVAMTIHQEMHIEGSPKNICDLLLNSTHL